MDLFSRDDLRTLLANRQTPCVSLLMPTTRGAKEEDRKRWQSRIADAEEQLVALGRRGPEAKDLLQPARALLDDAPFWLNVSNGLAGFFSPETVSCYRLPLPFGDQAVVADGFHVKPLLPLLSGSGRFYVLSLGPKGVRLFLGTQRTVQEIDLEHLPANLDQAPRWVDGGWRVAPAPGTPGGGAALIPGPGVLQAGSKEERLRYFHQVDGGLKRLLQVDQAPLLVGGDEDLVALYRQANSYPHLLAEPIVGHPDRLTSEGLHERAWAAAQLHFRAAEERMAGLYKQLAGTGRTANDLAEVVAAAYEGHVQYLFVPLNREVWGTFDPANRKVVVHDMHEAGDQDLLNVAAAHTLAHRGTAFPVEPGQMPDNTPVAAIFWLPAGQRGNKTAVPDAIGV